MDSDDDHTEPRPGDPVRLPRHGRAPGDDALAPTGRVRRSVCPPAPPADCPRFGFRLGRVGSAGDRRPRHWQRHARMASAGPCPPPPPRPPSFQGNLKLEPSHWHHHRHWRRVVATPPQVPSDDDAGVDRRPRSWRLRRAERWVHRGRNFRDGQDGDIPQGDNASATGTQANAHDIRVACITVV